jgi:hypothetical protein
MPIKCFNKPNRKNPRYFSMCDAARVAREVVRTHPEDTPEEVLACIARGLGFTHISLSHPRMMESFVGPGTVELLPGGLVKATSLVRLLVARYAWAAKAATALGLLPLLDTISKVLDDMIKLPPQVKVEDAFGTKCDCGNGKKAIAQVKKFFETKI